MSPQGVVYRKEDLEDVYDIEEELGRGCFAAVCRCTSKDRNIAYAAKFIKLKRTRSSRKGLTRDLVEREANILSLLDSPRIMKLHDVFDRGTEIVLVLELLSGGELFEKISEQEYLKEIEAIQYMQQILEGIKYMHDRYIAHLDIKPENIVLKSKDSTSIKLVDFGLAQKIEPGQNVKETHGTAEFVAPEIVNYELIGMYTDMWAIGVLAYILVSGDSPFLGTDNQETYEKIVNVDYEFYDEYFANISNDAKDFIEQLLIKSPKKRNTVSQCLEHPWITDASHPKRKDTVIETSRFKSFIARQRWQTSIRKLQAVSRFANLHISDDISPVDRREDDQLE